VLIVNASAEPLVKSGETIVFLGDSITQNGAALPGGYVSLVVSGFKSTGINIQAIPAGTGGHTSNDLIKRLQRDVIERKPDWVTISYGVNDVFRGANGGVTLEDYKTNLVTAVDKAQAAGIKVMIFTATLIGEGEGQDGNRRLAPYNVFLRQLAKDKNCHLADLNEVMWHAIRNPEYPNPGDGYLTVDGIHMNPLGNEVLAIGVLSAFGLTTADIVKAKTEWQDIPESSEIGFKMSISLRDYKGWCANAAKQSQSLLPYIKRYLSQSIGRTLAAEKGN